MNDKNKTRLIRNTKTSRLKPAEQTGVPSSQSDKTAYVGTDNDATVVVTPKDNAAAPPTDYVAAGSGANHMNGFTDLGGSAGTPDPAPIAEVNQVKDDGKTKVFRGHKMAPTASTENNTEAQADSAVASLNDEPVTGWLVIVEGPGEGVSLEFSFGGQSIGRSADQDISLCFGDEKISRDTHAKIEYDPVTRDFYLSKGKGYVYLNGGRVGEGSEKTLQSGDSIKLGDTVLRFIPFCGKDFCWQGES